MEFPFKIKDDRSFKNPKPYINNNPSEADLKNILRFVFGKASFREIQYESIEINRKAIIIFTKLIML